MKSNPSGSVKKAFVRKYLRNDSIKTRGQLLKKYHLSEEDLIEIEKFLLKNKKVSAKPTRFGLYRTSREQLTHLLKQKRLAFSTIMALFHK